MGKNPEKYFSIKTLPLKIILPALLTVALFVAAIFFLILPILESRMVDLKREMIQELTQSAWTILASFHEKEVKGILTSEKAKRQAVSQMRHMRYGPKLKDYFWISDMKPKMIMHPYRPDLEGKDVSRFADPKGKLIFLEFIKAVKKNGAGYVDYEWQWKDDPSRIVPKISYVKEFAPWGWIIGTGIYIEDVRTEIDAVTQNVFFLCIGISVLIALLSAYIIWQSVNAEKKARHHQIQLFKASKMATLGALASGVAHEINNPIMSVMLNAPILERVWAAAMPILDGHLREKGDFKIDNMDYSAIRQRVPVLLENISSSAKRVKNIVGDLKDFAREGKDDRKKPEDINKIVEKALVLVENLIKKSTVNFTKELKPSLPLCLVNAQRIEQVVINLLVNACQALKNPKDHIKISTDFRTESNEIIIEVNDGGTGISENIITRIKDPFFTTKRESGGTGLGLSICDRIIEEHGGSLVFESSYGKGTTVTVILPAGSGFRG